jgi:Tol biopolymer transport system component
VTRTVTATPTATRTGTITTTATVTATTPAGALGTPPDRIIYDELANGVLQIARVSGNGSGKTVLVPSGSQPALAPNGTTLAYVKAGTGIVTRGVSGGAETPVLCAGDGRYPSWSADGNNLTFNVLASNGAGQVFIAQPSCARTARTLVGIGFRPAWEPGLGRLILFDGCKASACGNLLTEPAFTPDPNNPTQVHGGQNGAWSPNGQQIAYQGTDANGHINVFVVNRNGSGARQITHGTHNNGVPIWSSDGRWIYYRSDQNGTAWAIYAARADGSGSQKIIDATPGGDWTYAKLAISR